MRENSSMRPKAAVRAAQISQSIFKAADEAKKTSSEEPEDGHGQQSHA